MWRSALVQTGRSWLRSGGGGHVSRRWAASGFAEEVVEGASEGSALRLSDRCVKRLREISRAREGKNVALRVTVEGGGCSGFQYKFELEDYDGRKEEDHVFERDGSCVVVDDVSLPFLAGSKVDFEEEMIRTSFKIVDNPNSDTSCSCGVSFSAK
mmetsp:Transcript_2694/g.8151  ORF Transcript_2694/g.8151 Transcript_2694/m.8151 type:complete len:155 (-) Transcript_2694:176-640(-)|eukprot:CAMPEP_0198729362 /NCGR_PEP_ID=MMETSP1475-20131203/17485_1 /TAXON_ID= ORGANISM="Unidentified sp., Strain CCMP1999" /NCGR_SAMPLE_ID=MMETSP1475 /ASSEMBLY_ACC=CAM_ASM_001111 /LENGTH=154 /DNA_ID=CAMNT_0044491979 /DNA_START=47 /DNA_END=511 /DNA_ORIENTATION=-